MLKKLFLSLVVLHLALSSVKAGISVDPVLTQVLELEDIIENGRVVGQLLRFRGGSVIHYTRFLPGRAAAPSLIRRLIKPGPVRMAGLGLIAAYVTTVFMTKWAEKSWACATEQAQIYYSSRADYHFNRIYAAYLREISRLMALYRARNRNTEEEILAWANREAKRLFDVAMAEADALATQETNAMFTASSCGDLLEYDTTYYSQYLCLWMPWEEPIYFE